MKRILFRKEAESDLQDIVAYFKRVAPESVANILSDIYRSIDQLVHYTSFGNASL